METGSFRNVVCCATEKFPIIINKYTWNHCQKFILSTEVVYMHRRMAENGVSKHFLPNFFFFHWHYSPLWALACRTISFHFILSATKSLHLLTNSTWRSLSTSSLHLFLGLPLLLVPSSSWVKIFLDILSSSILSRWPNQLILCPFIHFTIFSPFLTSSSSRFVRLLHSPFSYLGPYIAASSGKKKRSLIITTLMVYRYDQNFDWNLCFHLHHGTPHYLFDQADVCCLRNHPLRNDVRSRRVTSLRTKCFNQPLIPTHTHPLSLPTLRSAML